MLDDKRKQTLKKLLEAVIELTTECIEDDTFNMFIHELGIFELNAFQDLEEIQGILFDNLEDPQF